MKIEEILRMLEFGAKPDLKGCKAELLEKFTELSHGDKVNYNAFTVRLDNVTSWMEAGSSLAAAASLTRKENPKRKPGAVRGFYDNYGYSNRLGPVSQWNPTTNAYDKPESARTWNSDQRAKIYGAMKIAGVKAWEETLADNDPLKSYEPDLFLDGFNISITLGYRGSRSHSTENMYPEWGRTTVKASVEWPAADIMSMTSTFLALLEHDDELALTLAKYGYQNVALIDNNILCLIKMPAKLSLRMIRGQFRLHDVHGPAKITPGGDKQFFISGVRFDKTMFDSTFDKGELKISAKEILAISNTERRRVLMALVAPELILEQCEAQLLDGPTELGNSLFSVDIGLPAEWGQIPDPENPGETKWGQMPARVKMLKYGCPSTDRVYAKFVPNAFQENGKTVEITQADQAQAWSHHFTIEQYRNIAAQS